MTVPQQLGDQSLRPITHTEEWKEETSLSLPSETAKPTPPVLHPPQEVITVDDIYLTEDGTCNYAFEDGKACAMKLGDYRDQARHWVTVHVANEIKEIERGMLHMTNATIIKTEAKMKMVSKYKIYCPLWPS